MRIDARHDVVTVATHGVSAGVDARLRDVTIGLTRRGRAPHAAVALATGDDTWRWTGTTGIATADGTPLREDTRFFIASISKLFVAAVILKMHEEGELAVDGPMAEYLPRALISNIHRLRGVDYTDKITLRHLLTHTSGLPDWLEDRPRGARSTLERALRGEDSSWEGEHIVRYVAERLRPHFPPAGHGGRRRRPRYSNTNFDLLMLVAEHVAGIPYEDVLCREILQPLGLRNTVFPTARKPPDDKTVPGDKTKADIWLGRHPVARPRLLRSTRTLYSTLRDLLTFYRALVDGRLFTDEATWRLMTGGVHPFGMPGDLASLRAPRWPIGYALGVMHVAVPRPFSLLYPVPPLVGHTGFTGSWLFYCPELDLFLCGTISQAMGGHVPFFIVPRLVRIFQRAVL